MITKLINCLAVLVLATLISCSGGNKKAEKADDKTAPVDLSEETTDIPAIENIFYIGVNNPLQIDAEGYEASELDVSISNGNIYKEEGGYMVRVASEGTSLITISAGDEVLKTIEYRIEKVADPVAKAAGMNGGEIEKGLLLEAGNVYAEIENFNLNIEFKVISFTLTIEEGDNPVEEHSGSGAITTEQKELIRGLESGGEVVFSNILTMGPDGATRELKQIVFKIK